MTITIKAQSDYQQQLFNDLSDLVKNGEGEFLHKDYISKHDDNFFYRIFTYDLPKHSDFKKPNALNCRGTMFLIDKTTGEAQLIALPMQKFFSLGEGSSEDNKFKIEDAVRAFLKVDGSLLTSYICPFEQVVKFKSKNMPTFQEYDLVEKSISENLLKEITQLGKNNISVDLELTTPNNRVMIEYKDYNVDVLKARSLLTGEEINMRTSEFKQEYPTVFSKLVNEISVKDVDINRKDIEGYVLELPNGKLVKVKTLPYLSLVAVISIQDRSKETEYLYRAALDEVLDEVRSLHHYKANSPNYPLERLLSTVDKVEAYAAKTYRELINTVEALYEENKHLERSDYARKFGTIPEYKEFMPLLMDKYSGKEIDYKKSAVKIYAKKALNAISQENIEIKKPKF